MITSDKEIEKIENLINEANRLKLRLLEKNNYGNTIISAEQAREIIMEFRDKKIREILGED